MTSQRGTSTVNSGRGSEAEPIGLLLAVELFHQWQKFPQIPWSSLTENGCPHSTRGRCTPSLSRVAIKHIVLSAGDQVAHLSGWHTWANRPRIHHVHSSTGHSCLLLLTRRASWNAAVWQLWEEEEPSLSQKRGSLANPKHGLALLWQVPVPAAANTNAAQRL